MIIVIIPARGGVRRAVRRAGVQRPARRGQGRREDGAPERAQWGGAGPKRGMSGKGDPDKNITFG